MSKNPKRVAAGKANRLKRSPITQATREKLRAAALCNKPWKKSTGPRTKKGKEIASQNSRKTPAKDQPELLILEQAKLLLRTLTQTKKQCLINPDSLQLQSGDDVAAQLKAIIVGTNRELAEQRSQRLVG